MVLPQLSLLSGWFNGEDLGIRIALAIIAPGSRLMQPRSC